jgi:hypothetical protein
VFVNEAPFPVVGEEVAVEPVLRIPDPGITYAVIDEAAVEPASLNEFSPAVVGAEVLTRLSLPLNHAGLALYTSVYDISYAITSDLIATSTIALIATIAMAARTALQITRRILQSYCRL